MTYTRKQNSVTVKSSNTQATFCEECGEKLSLNDRLLCADCDRVFESELPDGNDILLQELFCIDENDSE